MPPAPDPSHWSLFPATPAQAYASRTRSSAQWKGNLTVEEYIVRDQQMETWESSRDGRLTIWVLAPRDDSKTLDFFCACETYRRIGSIVKNSHVEEVACYGIASVYTPPPNRGRGYGHHMMRLLHWVLASPSSPALGAFPSALGEFPAEWGAPPVVPEGVKAGDGLFSALWSDVGAFYGGCGPRLGKESEGWRIEGNVSTIWDLSHHKPTTDTDTDTGVSMSEEWKWLSAEEVKAEMGKEGERMKADLLEKGKAGEGEAKTHFTFLPDGGVEEFQRLRSQTRIRKAGIQPPDRWGLIAQDGFASWAIELKPNTLIVTRLRVRDAAQFAVLVRTLVKYAVELGLERVEIWGLEERFRESARVLGGETTLREEHLPAYMWYGEGEVQWAFNEKFCWC